MVVVRSLAFAIALVVLATPVARAQDGEREARELFERGTAAVHAGRLAEARVDLERSLALLPRASTGFNLIVALRGLGELVTADDVCARLLGGELGALDPGQRGEADAVCTELRAGIASVRVRATGTAPFELRLDGLSLGQLAPGDELEQAVDPGAHVLTTVAPGREPEDRSLDLDRGARVELELVGPTRTAGGDVDVGWIVAGSIAGALVLAGVITAVAVATTSPGPRDDYPVVATLRF